VVMGRYLGLQIPRAAIIKPAKMVYARAPKDPCPAKPTGACSMSIAEPQRAVQSQSRSAICTIIWKHPARRSESLRAYTTALYFLILSSLWLSFDLRCLYFSENRFDFRANALHFRAICSWRCGNGKASIFANTVSTTTPQAPLGMYCAPFKA